MVATGLETKFTFNRKPFDFVWMSLDALLKKMDLTRSSCNISLNQQNRKSTKRVRNCKCEWTFWAREKSNRALQLYVKPKISNKCKWGKRLVTFEGLDTFSLVVSISLGNHYVQVEYKVVFNRTLAFPTIKWLKSNRTKSNSSYVHSWMVLHQLSTVFVSNTFSDL